MSPPRSGRKADKSPVTSQMPEASALRMVLRTQRANVSPSFSQTEIVNRECNHSHDSLDSSSSFWVVRTDERRNLTQDVSNILLDSPEDSAELGEGQARARVSEEVSEGLQGGLSSGASQVLYELFQ
jgi:hypothetical protein